MKIYIRDIYDPFALVENEKTGIEKLKEMKRKRQIDDIWAQMQEEEDYRSKPKHQKIEEKQRVGGQESGKKGNSINSNTNNGAQNGKYFLLQ